MLAAAAGAFAYYESGGTTSILPGGTVRTLDVTCFPRRGAADRQTVDSVVLLVSDVTPAD